MNNELEVLNTLCKQLYESVDHNERVQAEHNLEEWSNSPDCLRPCTLLLERGNVESKWAAAPPVEHFDREHFAVYFPQHFYDLRYQPRVPDPCNIGLNESPELEKRFKDYKVLRRADKVDDH